MRATITLFSLTSGAKGREL